MKVTLLVTGKTDSKWLSEGIDTFIKRLRHYTSLEMKVLPDPKNTRNMPVGLQKEKEGQQILDYLEGKSEVYLLDEGGQQYTSRELAAFIEKKNGCRMPRNCICDWRAFWLFRTGYKNIIRKDITFQSDFFTPNGAVIVCRATLPRTYHHQG